MTALPNQTAEQKTAPTWVRRFLFVAVGGLLPLFLFGGSVTTLGAGMAVEGWWNAEGHFMPFFPVEEWFRDLATFVEHSHRQFGLIVGLAMLLACVATRLFDRRRSARWLVFGATVGVGLQGWLGGSRVLEDSPQLAFIHGSFAQAVFAVLLACLFHQSRTWRTAERRREPSASGLRRYALLATLVVYLQVIAGASYRHALRTGLAGDVTARLNLHLLGALVALVFVLILVARLSSSGDETCHRLRRRIQVLMGVQMALGFLALGAGGSGGSGGVSFFEWATSTLHVLVGALLLSQCVLVAMWSFRAFETTVEETTVDPVMGGVG